VHRVLEPLVNECLIAAPSDFGLGCRLVADHHLLPGPVGGLVAGLEAARTDLVLAVPADLPFPVARLALELALIASSELRSDVVIPCRDGRLEPLFAVYRRRAAGRILHVASPPVGSGRGPSLIEVVGLLPRWEVPESTWRRWDPDGDSFSNCNTPDELAAAAMTVGTSNTGGSP
jgi:molybdopterin-guanine dinucleotide biosynthesis protein A